MPKIAALGNGKVLIGLDEKAQIKELYFPYPGLENHLGKNQSHKLGVFVDQTFSWLNDDDWKMEYKNEPGTMSYIFVATNDKLGLKLILQDVLYNEKNVYIRKVIAKNLFGRKREIKLFFNQQYTILQNVVGDTAYFDPVDRVLIHYKGRRVFLSNVFTKEAGIKEYSVGLQGIEFREGTYKDAEDGELSKNPIEHGHVDSVCALTLELEPEDENICYYWLAVAKSIEKAKSLNELVAERGPESIMQTTINYWRAWANVQNFSYYGLSEEVVELFKQSLLVIRTHVGSNGAIIASCDSDLLQFGRDTYAYVWPRDAAYAAIALARAGDFNASKRFFEFCNHILTDRGYFMHKYRPDYALGSSWHPWVRNGEAQLPIQEDEIALVLISLWKYFQLSKDIEFIEGIYNSMIKKAAEFMTTYLDERTGLPAPSYDLWEQQYQTTTFTASAVAEALHVAARFAHIFGKEEAAKRYSELSETLHTRILKYLYDQESGIFYKGIEIIDKNAVIDKTIDISSLYAIYEFNILPRSDKRLKKAFDTMIPRLSVLIEKGGLARYEGDTYHHRGGDYPGNPWIIGAMWVAQFEIKNAQNEEDMETARKWISWVLDHSGQLGILPEQVNPYTGEHVSATPLVWSHSEFVITIIDYLEKIEELGICKACYPLT